MEKQLIDAMRYVVTVSHPKKVGSPMIGLHVSTLYMITFTYKPLEIILTIKGALVLTIKLICIKIYELC